MTIEETPKKTPRDKRDNLSSPWKKGQSGNPKGRPKGARSKLSNKFCKAVLDDFKENGVDAIRLMRIEKPNEYTKMIASMLPKEIDAQVEADVTPELKQWLGQS